jgi:hypothetical protein
MPVSRDMSEHLLFHPAPPFAQNLARTVCNSGVGGEKRRNGSKLRASDAGSKRMGQQKRENQTTTGALLVKHTSISADVLARLPRATYGEIFEASLWQPLIDAAARYHSIAKAFPARDLLSSVALTK